MEGYRLSFDQSDLQFDRIYAYLSKSYWSPDIRRDLVERAIRNSLFIGIYEVLTGDQIGFARLVTDYGRFAYLCDVFVLESHQGKGIAQWMIQALMDHDDVKTVGHWTLATKDAHSLYKKLGFEPANERYMMMRRSNDRWQEQGSNAS
jgi:GNAT superfamily N-acetyltransferase